MKTQSDLNLVLRKSVVDEKEALEVELKDTKDILEKVKTDHEKSVSETVKVKIISEIENLLVDINNLQFGNDQKEILLNKLSYEKKILGEKVNNLEDKNAFLELQLYDKRTLEEEIGTSSLSEELIQADSKFAVTQFQCKYCEEIVASKNDLKSHFQTVHIQEMRFKVMEMEKKLSDDRTTIVKSLISLKQREAGASREPCVCKGFCSINHRKHNWKLSNSDMIYSKLNSHDLKNHQKTDDDGELDSLPLNDFNSPKEQLHTDDVLYSNFKCEVCQNKFASVEDMEKHKERDHKEILGFGCFSCNKCNKAFKQKVDLENHNKSKHVSRQKTTKYSCQQCHEMLTSMSDLKEHDEVNHDIDFSCVLCKIEFKSLHEMDSHMDDKHGGRWKKYDPDVLTEGDEESESSDDFTDSDDSETEEREN